MDADTSMYHSVISQSMNTTRLTNLSALDQTQQAIMDSRINQDLETTVSKKDSMISKLRA